MFNNLICMPKLNFEKNNKYDTFANVKDLKCFNLINLFTRLIQLLFNFHPFER